LNLILLCLSPISQKEKKEKEPMALESDREQKPADGFWQGEEGRGEKG
jgi:hypothetical protein